MTNTLENKEMKNPVIEALRYPIKNLLGQLSNSIEGSKYNLIIGDDASGRVPTLIFNKVISDVYKKKGAKKPDVIFLPGSGTDAIIAIRNIEKYMEDIFKKRGIDPGKTKILIVADTIMSGESLRPLSFALRGKKIEYDIATVGLQTVPGMLSVLESAPKLGGKIYYGEKGTPKIYGRPELSGINKEYGDLKSTRYSDFKTSAWVNMAKMSEKTGVLNPQEINKLVSDAESRKVSINKGVAEARKDVDILSDQLVKWYEDNKSKITKRVPEESVELELN